MKDKEKQIEEIARVLGECCGVFDENGRFVRNKCNSVECEFWSDENYCCCSYSKKESLALYNAGYKKASEVAREIFEEIDRMCIDTFGNFNHRVFTELKKKYTEVGNGK